MKRRFETIRTIAGPPSKHPTYRDKQGTFLVYLDPDYLVELMERASTNKSQNSHMGAIRVEYKANVPASEVAPLFAAPGGAS